MLDIRAARAGEFAAVRGFYHELIDMMEGSEFHPRWEKCVYPSDDFLRSSIERGELYIGLTGEETAAAMVINGEGAEGYAGAPWSVRAADGEFSVIHALCVLPSHHGRGFARELVAAAKEIARSRGHRALRLDVLNGNLPAVKLYESEGFRFVSRVKLFYEDTGLTDFLLYEYAL